jgi:hypothetical protein
MICGPSGSARVQLRLGGVGDRLFLRFQSITDPALFITKAQQQYFKFIKCLLFIRSDRFDDNTSAAIEIGAKDFQYARGRETLLVLTNCDLALELYNALNKFRRWPRVQPEFVYDLEFSLHGKGNIESTNSSFKITN